jgi:hypothetical protein
VVDAANVKIPFDQGQRHLQTELSGYGNGDARQRQTVGFFRIDCPQLGMAVHGTRNQCGRLPEAVPLDITHTTRLSWELGSRVIDDEESTLEGQWHQSEAGWMLSVYRVTNHTDLLQLRTPVGRERFYGVTQTEFESALSTLEAADHWQ